MDLVKYNFIHGYKPSVVLEKSITIILLLVSTDDRYARNIIPNWPQTRLTCQIYYFWFNCQNSVPRRTLSWYIISHVAPRVKILFITP